MVIAIIAILTAIVMTNFGTSRAKARDAKRISDLNQIQLALELYFDRCKEYPAVNIDGVIDDSDLSANNGDGCSSASISLSSFISKIPTPPLPIQGNETAYGYFLESSSDNTNYLLHITLENDNEALKDVEGQNVIGSGVDCTGKRYCIRPY